MPDLVRPRPDPIAALQKFGRHLPNCRANQEHARFYDDCDCGLAAALRADAHQPREPIAALVEQMRLVAVVGKLGDHHLRGQINQWADQLAALRAAADARPPQEWPTGRVDATALCADPFYPLAHETAAQLDALIGQPPFADIESFATERLLVHALHLAAAVPRRAEPPPDAAELAFHLRNRERDIEDLKRGALAAVEQWSIETPASYAQLTDLDRLQYQIWVAVKQQIEKALAGRAEPLKET